tara:strand:+ start:154 stop:366 length:213 start_codon:yes stop_codon:yes gene_type:complete
MSCWVNIKKPCGKCLGCHGMDPASIYLKEVRKDTCPHHLVTNEIINERPLLGPPLRTKLRMLHVSELVES